jgi:hypothetical protein
MTEKENLGSEEADSEAEPCKDEASPKDRNPETSKLLDIDLMKAELKVIVKMAVPVSLTGSLQVLHSFYAWHFHLLKRPPCTGLLCLIVAELDTMAAFADGLRSHHTHVCRSNRGAASGYHR